MPILSLEEKMSILSQAERDRRWKNIRQAMEKQGLAKPQKSIIISRKPALVHFPIGRSATSRNGVENIFLI